MANPVGQVSLEIEFDASGPVFDQNLKRLVGRASRQAITNVALNMVKDIKEGLRPSPSPNVIGGRNTGHLSRGIRHKVFGDTKADVRPGKYVYGQDVPYAWQVEHGRRASGKTVRPVRAKALRFKPRGSSKYIIRQSSRPFKKRLTGTRIFERTADRYDSGVASKEFLRELKKQLEGNRL